MTCVIVIIYLISYKKTIKYGGTHSHPVKKYISNENNGNPSDDVVQSSFYNLLPTDNYHNYLIKTYHHPGTLYLNRVVQLYIFDNLDFILFQEISVQFLHINGRARTWPECWMM